MYCDEKMLLDIRLNILNKYVDKFVIVESNFYHNGESKKLTFDINEFSDFKEKIIYVKVVEKPTNIKKYHTDDKKNIDIFNALLLENFQRNKILLGLFDSDLEDIIIISDIDEIPDLKNIDFSLISEKFLFFKQDFFYYKFNLKHPNLKWFGSRATKKKNLKTPQFLRNLKTKVYPWWRFDVIFSKKKTSSAKIIENGGWHFTNIKSVEDIYKKLNYFLHHTEFKNSGIKIDDLNRFIKDEVVYYDHQLDQSNQNKWNANISLEKVNIDKLPNYIQENYNKFKLWIKN
jgi:beta-1,4-mannosyl-glycoprotein beta-1,4-N-acetylglucosaminyltransferase